MVRASATPPSAAGFTLIEVLVALAIVAVALAAAVRAVGMLAVNDRVLRDKALALQSAENVLADLRLAQVFPAPGISRVACPQGSLTLNCEMRVSGTPNANFRRVTVTVRDSRSPESALAELDGLVSNRR